MVRLFHHHAALLDEITKVDDFTLDADTSSATETSDEGMRHAAWRHWGNRGFLVWPGVGGCPAFGFTTFCSVSHLRIWTKIIKMERRKDEMVTRSYGGRREVFGLIAIGTRLGRGVHMVMAETKRL